MENIIRLFHVGGRGDTIGPVDCMLDRIGENLELTIFEADPDLEKTAGFSEGFDEKLGKFKIVPRCISNCVGRRNFYIYAEAGASSLLKMSPDAREYTRAGRYPLSMWEAACKPVRTVEVDVTTLDELCTSGQLPPPDFLSLDVQGAEHDILEGASKALQGDLMGVVSEVEFREIYEGQKLFADQDVLLRKHRFKLYELYNPQYWYSTPRLTTGRAALVLAEALWLRDFKHFIKKDIKDTEKLYGIFSKLLKLMVIASSFGRYCYAQEILTHVLANWPCDWEEFIKKNPYRYFNEFIRVLTFVALPPLTDLSNLPYSTRTVATIISEASKNHGKK